MSSSELMRLPHLGLLKSLHIYQDSVNERDKLPDWERLCFDLVQEVIRRNTRDGVTSISNEEEYCSLVCKGKNSEGMEAQGEAESNQNNGKKKELSKKKCFHNHEYGHYATKCPHKKSRKESTTRA